MSAQIVNLPSERSHQTVDVVIGDPMLDFVLPDGQEGALHNNPPDLWQSEG